MIPVGTVALEHPLCEVGPRGRIGLLALSTDLNSEADLRRMAPAGVEIFTSRIENANPVTVANLRAMAGDIPRAARTLLPGMRLDALVYGCTSGAAAIGDAALMECIHSVRPGLPVTHPLAAVEAALDALGARSVSLLTPYAPAVTGAVAEHFAGRGIGLDRIGGLGLESDEEMAAVPPAAVIEAGLAFCHPASDALFVACTALPAARFVAALEDRLGKPVVASNQALMWHALRLIGITDRVAGFGRLFDLPCRMAAEKVA